MARLDWDMTLAFDAAETETLGVDGLASVPPDCWGQLRFEFHPSLYRNDFHWSVFEFRAAAERDDPQLSAPERSDNPVSWILWRQGLRVQYRSMAVDEAFTLDAAIRGENFETLCAGLTEWVDEDHAAGRAVAFLKRWLVDELIVGTQV